MSRFLCLTTVSRTSSVVNVSCVRLRWFSVSSEDDKKLSFVVSYFINSFGFSLNKALVASKYVNFKNSTKPDKTIEFFKSYGFSETQIIKLVRICPLILKYDTKKTIMPKLEFLISKGLTLPEMTKSLSAFPKILGLSFSNQVVPSYYLLRDFLRSDKKTISAVQRYPSILGSFKNVLSNIDVLREHGIPDSKVAYQIEFQPRSFTVSSFRFRRLVEEIVEMGFNTSTRMFTTALCVSLGLSKSTWQSKVDTYKMCGFSEDEVSKAFLRHPYFMAHSEGKVLAGMNFFTNEMSLSPSVIAIYPMALGLSLKKRIIPRCVVFRVLLSKGLVKKKSTVNLKTLLLASEDKFRKKYIEPYKKEARKLLKLYNENVGLNSQD